jgi:CheY-like chemotaxis protein
MDRDTLAHAFEPFYTTKASGEGTGLGLATTYGIVEQNRGLITLSSVVGRGTSVSVYFPRSVDRTAAATTAVTPRPPTGTQTVLLVEDEPAVLRLSKRLLENLGYAVLTATSAPTAIRLADERSGDVDLLVTDIVMPGMNGKELAAELVRRYPTLKYLLVSGYPGGSKSGQVFDVGGAHFLQKPFTQMALANKVREVLEN